MEVLEVVSDVLTVFLYIYVCIDCIETLLELASIIKTNFEDTKTTPTSIVITAGTQEAFQYMALADQPLVTWDYFIQQVADAFEDTGVML